MRGKVAILRDGENIFAGYFGEACKILGEHRVEPDFL